MGAVIAVLVPRGYARRFGRVQGRYARIDKIIVGAVVGVVLIAVAWAVDSGPGAPLLIAPMVFAVVLGVGQKLLLRRTGLTPVHWIVYGLVFLSAFVPLAMPSFYPVLPVLGAGLVVIGLVDHFRLVRFMTPAATDPNPESGA